MARNVASPPKAVTMRRPGPASFSRPFAVLAASSVLLLSLQSCVRPTSAAAVAVAATAADGDAVHRHVRHKRTVSDFVEGLMNAMYFNSDPDPMPSTVIARITHMPATKVYKYVPVQTLKVSKIRARHLAEPKFKIKYPKKYSIKTEGSSLTLVKNELPWTLHPLPPPLPTSKTIKLEVDKSMPWALHPLPPPVKTKSYSEYYWPDPKGARPKYAYRFRPSRPHRFRVHHNNNNKYVNSRPLADKKPHSHYNNNKPVDYKPAPVDYNHEDYNHVDNNDNGNNNNNKPEDYKYDDHRSEDYSKPDDYGKPDDYNKHGDFSPVDFKQIDFKQVDYKHVDYKSPDYKADYPKHQDEENDDGDGGGGGGDHDHVFHHSFSSHDDHESPHMNDMSSPSSQPPSADFVSHITIEPSIQIAAFSDTELQGDGSNRDSVSQGSDAKHKCQCSINNGHRHKRHAPSPVVNGTAAAVNNTAAKDLVGSQSARLHTAAYFGVPPPHVGHATEVQIVKSHDITDQTVIGGGGGGVPTGSVKRVRDMSAEQRRPTETNRGNDATTAFRDESDKFKVDFGREINLWDEPKPSSADQGQFLSASSSVHDSDGNGRGFGNGDGYASVDGYADDYGNRQTGKPDQGKNYHIITTVTKTSNHPSDDDDDRRGVGFSVQTPFSVSSFSSNIRHPLMEDRFRFTDTSSPLLSSLRQQSDYSEPLDFEQFGLKSALIDDNPLDSGRLTTHFSRDGFGGGNSPSGFSGRITSHFSRDFGNDDRGRLRSSKPFRHRSKSGSDLFDNRFRSSSDGSVLEYFQPVVIDFNDDKLSDKLRYKSDSSGFSKFKRNQNSDPLRLPNGLHEASENLSRKTIFHPSTFDID